MHSDPIADMATRIRNAFMAKHTSVRIPYSKTKESVLQVMQAKTFIEGYSVVKDGKFEELEVQLPSKRDELTITRVSKPGQRIYKSADELQSVRRGLGILVVSTSQGVMAGFEAYKKGIGGEVMLEVY